MTHATPACRTRSLVVGSLVFLVTALASGLTVAGPGLTWDEPAYRYSQLRLEAWIGMWNRVSNWDDASRLVDADTIAHYFEYNRPGPNFHPPMAGYLNLLTHALFGGAIDDLASRRLASSFELALAAALLAGAISRRYGIHAGLLAGLSFPAMPRVFGDSHIAGTDMPILLFWTIVALTFLPALGRRSFQWLFALAWAGLFLVKFSGNAIVLPIAVAFLIYLIAPTQRRHWPRWIVWSVLVAAPLLPLAVTVLWGAKPEPTTSLETLARAGYQSSGWLFPLFFAPSAVLFLHSRWRKPADWPIGLELPWIVAAVTPLTAIALNPTWWHDPVARLADFVDLSLRRQGYLPDIEILYLGEQYVFSLPWHNGFVLAGLTIPLGLLVLGIVGAGRSVVAFSSEAFPAYLLLHALTLPLLRMFPVPAHDGVRLMLPTFVFWAGLVGVAGAALSARFPSRLLWPALFVIGPVGGAFAVARIHPYELSYYNVGLARAQGIGMEVTYWYDAVTEDVLDQLNDRLPANAVVGFPSPAINPEVFQEHQSRGRLRPDIRLDVSKADDFPYMLLLTHGSKSTPFTRLLFGLRPWLSHEWDNVRLFSVVEPRRVAVAWAIHALAVEYRSEIGNPPTPTLSQRILEVEESSLRRAVECLADRDAPTDLPAEVATLVREWSPGGRIKPDLARLLEHHRPALDEAITILKRRPSDVESLIQSAGYPPIERRGGFLDED